MNRFWLPFVSLLCSFPLILIAQPENADKLLKQIEKHKSQDTMLVNLLNQYAYSTVNENYPNSYQKATEAYSLAKHLNYESGIAWAAVRISAYHTFYSLQFDEAAKYALEALKIGEAINDKKVQSKAYTYMAICYSKSNDSLSLFYMQKSVSLAEDGGDEESITTALLNLAITHIQQNNYGAALKVLNTTLLHAEKLGKESILMGVYANLGRVHQGLADWDAAMVNYEKGISLANKQKNYRYWSFQLVQVGEIYHTKKNTLLAIQYVLKALHIAEENQLKESSMDAYEALSGIYRDMGRFKEAYTYQSLYHKIADSTNNLQSAQNIERLQQTYKLEKEKIQAEQLLKEEEQKTFNQFVAIGLGIVALSILVILLSGSIVVRPGMVKLLGVLGLLITFEFLNLLLHPFLESITHHTPVLMLACLAGIAGLLIPLHHRLEKWVTSKLVEKNTKIHLASARKIIAAGENATNIEQSTD